MRNEIYRERNELVHLHNMASTLANPYYDKPIVYVTWCGDSLESNESMFPYVDLTTVFGIATCEKCLSTYSLALLKDLK